MGSKSDSSNQSQSTSTQTLDPQIKASLLGNYGNVQNLVAGTPSAYTGQLVAGFDPAQTQAQQGILNLANSGVGNAALDGAQTAESGVAGYQAPTVTAGQIASTDLSPYLDPYTKDVTNTTLSDLDRSRQIANVGNDASATSAGAFGGDRSAVLDSLTNGEYARTAASTLANLNSSNYTNAEAMAGQDIASREQADLANQGAAGTAAGLRLNAGTGLAALSGQQVSQATALQNLIAQVGAQRQAQAQAGLTANQQQFQTNLGNRISLQQLIDQALGLAGDPTLGSSQSTASGHSSTTTINSPSFPGGFTI